MSAGPSLAPKSTPGESRAKASVGSSTPAVRQWGMAMPPGRPVAEVSSRASASVDELVDVRGAAGVADDAGQRADHLVLVGAERASSRTRSR